ncbi:30S ribosomal protein S12 methylthiotransferase RimO [Natranaerobius trueperi]|uniref:Ribosomal protein uS12 methylthiotransferase RimO n=1 Tax=Natranaerobius trueperi TaxID=759412 RepID=A0A226C129_9FIRM|nr:30S ribosomal protein S12 methylthiotransferase RimO [Natranaerobius trueperi]
MEVGILSLGCAKNQVDTEVMQGVLKENKYQLTDDYYSADIVIINTCGFIDDAKKESIDHILEVAKLRSQGKIKALIVAGCLSQRYQESIKEEIPEIDALIGTENMDRIGEVISSVLQGEFVSYLERRKINDKVMPREPYTFSHSVYVKIAEGCNNHCSYCAIPIIRGQYRSRSIEGIEKEVISFIEKGAKEINLIAQDTTYYGKDLYGSYKLAELLERIASLEGDFWVRVLYGYPTRITDELIEVINKHDKICSYLDIPLQHVSDNVLKGMNRGGNENQIRDLVYKLRDQIPNLTLRTSFIVGFPGETEDDFNKLLSFIEEVEFDHVGVFRYSKEEDTKAYEMKQEVSEEIKEDRYMRTMELQQSITRQKNEEKVGKFLKVLIDEKLDDEPTTSVARGKMHAPEVDGSIIVPNCNASVGEFVDIEVIHALDYDLIGEMTNELSE